jgi:hypothetical protein
MGQGQSETLAIFWDKKEIIFFSFWVNIKLKNCVMQLLIVVAMKFPLHHMVQ